MTIEVIRVSQQCKEQLIRLKRVTGLTHWNELCRIGFCLSLSVQGVPPQKKILLDSNIEMTWKVFSGKHRELYMALLKMRLISDNLPLDDATLNEQFKLHLHRGISYLAANKEIRRIDDLVSLMIRSERFYAFNMNG